MMFFIATALAGPAQPVITSQPQDVTAAAGTTALFSVIAYGTLPLTFQWWYSGYGLTNLLNGETNASLTLTNVQVSTTAGSYWVVVTNVQGAVTSSVVTLIVLTPPTIHTQPANQTASLFADARFLVVPAGSGPLSYQWRLNGVDLLGKTNTTLSITNVQRSDAGNYAFVVTNFAGSVTSQVATLTIVPFNSIYCFGFSWTCTSGLEPNGSSCNLDPPQWYQHRASNGPLWPEFLSTNLGLAYVGPNNLAACGATSSDIMNQVNGFRIPSKPDLSLYCMWADGPDADIPTLSRAATNQYFGNPLLQATVLNNSNALNRLYEKGAREILIEYGTEWPTNAPWTLQLFGTNTALVAAYNEYVKGADAAFIDVMNAFGRARPDLRILSFNVMSNVIDVMADPAPYGFTQTSLDALYDPSLLDKSFTGPGANYMFWGWHPTSKLHRLITAWHMGVLTNSVLETLDVNLLGGSTIVQMNHLQIGRDYTLQKSTDLSIWSDVQTFTASDGVNLWTGNASGPTTRFYRLKWQR
jgi:phospholipase/lecithinase/hemolysin